MWNPLHASFSLHSHPTQVKDQNVPVAPPQALSPAQLPEEAECLTVPKYKRDLVQKLKTLRQELSQQQPPAGHCRIEVCREEIFEVRTSKAETLLENLCLQMQVHMLLAQLHRQLFLSILIFAYLKRKALPGVNMYIKKLFFFFTNTQVLVADIVAVH